MKRYTAFLVVMFVFAVFANGQSAKSYYKAGDKFFEVEQFENALLQFTKAVELDPEYDKAYVRRAETYEKLNQFAEAAEDYERALVFVPKDEEINYKAGKAYFKSEELGKALLRLNYAISRKSNYLEAYQVRTQVFLGLNRYDDALEDCKKALRLRENEVNFYNLGQVYEKLELFPEAEIAYQKSIRKNSNVVDSHFALALLSYNSEKFDMAMASANNVILINPRNKEGLILRARIYAKQMQLSKAVDDISVALNMFKNDPVLYNVRGDFYQDLSRHSDAINDYTNTLENGDANAEVYYKRARSYELSRNFEAAMADYEKLLEMSEYDGNAQRLYAQAEERMFEINREEDKPVVSLVDPMSGENKTVNIPRGIDVIPLEGFIVDESAIKTLKVNDFTVQPTEKEEGFEFLASINLRNANQITIEVTDVYDNSETAIFNVIRTETDKPVVNVIAPYASDNHIIFLDTDDPVIYVEGKVSDESNIKSIYINDIVASYIPNDLNPIFSARVRVENQGKFTVTAEDMYGNISSVDFTLNRESANFADNPMGKTWAIFINNSDYESFASLEGPTKDVTLMKTALTKYQIHNFIEKKNMSKIEMEKFFAIELRDLLRSNRVSSILVWYAGHGKYVNETGYWIPIDANRDDEFTYFNVNQLKASMQTYPESVTHTLVITDACESGPSFYQAMRSTPVIRSCDDWEATRFKSSQVYSSAGLELAVDNSQFTKTFANTLANNPGACIPIESIVQKVNSAVTGNNQQKPLFGKIAGLEDENGTFFFIPKDY